MATAEYVTIAGIDNAAQQYCAAPIAKSYLHAATPVNSLASIATQRRKYYRALKHLPRRAHHGTCRPNAEIKQQRLARTPLKIVAR